MAKRTTITIDSDIYEQFKAYCKENGYEIKARVQFLIRNEIKK